MALITVYACFNLLAFFGFLIVLAWLYTTWKFQYWKKRGVVSVPTTPFFGNFYRCLTMQQSAGHWMQEMYNYGAGLPYVGFYIFGKPCLMLRDPELIKSVLVKDFNYFQDRYTRVNMDEHVTAAGLFFMKNPPWKYVRTKISPVYTSGKVKKLFDLMVEVAKDLDTHLESLQWEGDTKTLEFKELCAKFTTDMIATTAFGLKVNCLNNPEAEFRKQGRAMFTFTTRRTVEFISMFFVPELLKPLKLRFFSEENVKFLRTAFWDAANERERTGEKRCDLIDLLLELRRTQADEEKSLLEFDGDNLVGQAGLFWNAGFETSATVFSFTLYELALHSDIQTKLRSAIISAIDECHGKITYDMVFNLPYLDMVVSETLRMYAPLPLLDRIVESPYKVPNSNLTLKEGTPVFVSLFGLHYDPEYFPNPHAYDPERFTPENKKSRNSCSYLPFGDGPRNCIGLRIGLLQAKLGLVQLLRGYEVSPCPETLIPMRLNPRATITASDGGIFLNIRKIS